MSCLCTPGIRDFAGRSNVTVCRSPQVHGGAHGRGHGIVPDSGWIADATVAIVKRSI
jgi:hypothetical protein